MSMRMTAMGRSTRWAIYGVLVVSVVAILVYLRLRPKPVVMIPEDKSNVFIATDAQSLTKARMALATHREMAPPSSTPILTFMSGRM